MNFNTIVTRLDNHHLTITLNRPHKRNALNDLMVRELRDAFKNAESDKNIRVITLTGNGKIFCSGADLEHLQQLKKNNYQDNLKDSLNLSKLYLEIYSCPKPVISVVRGGAIAGGCGLAAVCDFVISGKEAVFGYPEVRIGFVAAIVSAFLIRQIGERKARELMISGQLISAEEAFRIGLITTVIADKQSLESAHGELIGQLLKNSPLAMSESKRIINGSIYPEIEKEMVRLSKINADFRQTNEFIEGISSFLEKRAPRWAAADTRK